VVIERMTGKYPEIEVLYGDTDSLFLKLPPHDVATSFDFCEKLCGEITLFFPHPGRIKLEKIYECCVLQNKKRYCGLMRESASQSVATLDVKGLEMKRRDQCLFVARVMGEVVLSVFRRGDFIEAEAIFREAATRAIHGDLPLIEFIFAREVRLGTYRGIEPPGAQVARRRGQRDPRLMPVFGERIPYIVAASAISSRVQERVVSPEEFEEQQLRVDARFYIERSLAPAVGRLLLTSGVNVGTWLQGLGYGAAQLRPAASRIGGGLDYFMESGGCPLCGRQARGVCATCSALGPRTDLELSLRVSQRRVLMRDLEGRCARCMSLPGARPCDAFCWACPKFWELRRAEDEAAALSSYLPAPKARG
jgi:DNA polymerase zeta